MCVADNITQTNMPLYPLSYDIISLTNLKITQHCIYYVLDFAENQIIFGILKFKIVFG